MAPADERELRDMLAAALALESPVALRYPRGQGCGADLTAPMQEIPLGGGRVIRDGSDVTLLAIGAMLTPALAAAETLAASGVQATVMDARFAKPLDEELILQAAAAGPIVTIEENVLAGGFGAAVVELLLDRGVCTAGVRRLGIPDRFISHGSREKLWADIGMDAAGIAAAAASMVSRPETPV